MKRKTHRKGFRRHWKCVEETGGIYLQILGIGGPGIWDLMNRIQFFEVKTHLTELSLFSMPTILLPLSFK